MSKNLTIAYCILLFAHGMAFQWLLTRDKLTTAQSITECAIAWKSATQPEPVIRIVEKRVFAGLEDLPKISANMLPPLPYDGRLK